MPRLAARFVFAATLASLAAAAAGPGQATVNLEAASLAKTDRGPAGFPKSPDRREDSGGVERAADATRLSAPAQPAAPDLHPAGPTPSLAWAIALFGLGGLGAAGLVRRRRAASARGSR